METQPKRQQATWVVWINGTSYVPFLSMDAALEFCEFYVSKLPEDFTGEVVFEVTGYLAHNPYQGAREDQILDCITLEYNKDAPGKLLPLIVGARE